MSLLRLKSQLWKSMKRTSGKRDGKLRRVKGAGPATLGNSDVSNQRKTLRASKDNLALRASSGAAFGKSIGNPDWYVAFQPSVHPPRKRLAVQGRLLAYFRPLPNGRS